MPRRRAGFEPSGSNAIKLLRERPLGREGRIAAGPAASDESHGPCGTTSLREDFPLGNSQPNSGEFVYTQLAPRDIKIVQSALPMTRVRLSKLGLPGMTPAAFPLMET